MNAKCKKFLTMLLLVCVSIGAAGCSAYSNQRYYERAQLMMGSGEYAEKEGKCALVGMQPLGL